MANFSKFLIQKGQAVFGQEKKDSGRCYQINSHFRGGLERSGIFQGGMKPLPQNYLVYIYIYILKGKKEKNNLRFIGTFFLQTTSFD